jgi:hypothetical protein
MEIAACRAEDVDELERFMPSNSVAGRHGARFARQEAGGSTYLIPWLDGRPVGHAEVRWNGCEAPEVRAALPGCPEINGLLVWPERLAPERGLDADGVRQEQADACVFLVRAL